MIDARDVTISRRTREAGERVILEGVDFRIGAGELVVVLGRPGAGKTTLLEVLAGLLPFAGGRICLQGVDLVPQMDGSQPTVVRDGIGFLFQSPERQLFGRNALEDVSWGLGPGGVARAHGALEAAGIPPAHRVAPMPTLSRGEKRRVALAGVLVRNPSLLFLDEPSVGLDPEGQAALWKEISAYRAQRGAAVVVATHWPEGLWEEAAGVVCLVKGKQRFCGRAGALRKAARADRDLAGLLPFAARLQVSLEERGESAPDAGAWAHAALKWLRQRSGCGDPHGARGQDSPDAG